MMPHEVQQLRKERDLQFLKECEQADNTPGPPRARASRCQNGHELSEDNVQFTKKGYRLCKICLRSHRLKQDLKRKEERKRGKM
jgi:hypothetical protein